MKAHIVLQMTRPLAGKIPSWHKFISNKAVTYEQTGTAVDSVFDDYGANIYVTTEYEPKNHQWAPEEIQAGLNRFYRLILRDHTTIPSGLVDAIQLVTDVEQVRPFQLTTTSIPKYLQLHQSTSASGERNSDLKNIHRINQGSDKLTIAVLDTGINMTHPELVHSLSKGHDFVNIIDGADAFVGDYLKADPQPDDEVGHGTHVAGIISGKGLKMQVGLAPKCKILPVRVLGAFRKDQEVVGAGLLENIDAGIKYAVDLDADIINMSLGVRHEGGGLPHKEVVDYARLKGVTIVAAAGNDGTNEKYYPGANPYVIAVGAADLSGNVARYSTYGAHVSVIAPGTNVYSSYLDHNYAFSSGTSQAAPYVSGALALLKTQASKKGHQLNDSQLKYLIKHTSDKVDRKIKNVKAGYGHLNISDALRLLEYKL